jgi:protein-tyrosine phosphatase
LDPDRRHGRKPDIRWTPVGAGRLALWHRPARRDLAALRDAGVTHLVTLLSDREGARAIGEQAKAVRLNWVWLPLQGATEPEADVRPTLDEGLANLSHLLDAGRSLLIHCSAGIHRTGMFAYALLRRRGLSRNNALATIEQARPHTREGLKEHHLRWGDEVAAQSPP